MHDEVEGGTDNFERFSDVVGTCNLFVREVDEWGQYSCPDQDFDAKKSLFLKQLTLPNLMYNVSQCVENLDFVIIITNI